MADELKVTQEGLEAIAQSESALEATQLGADIPLLDSTPVELRVTQAGSEPVVLFNPSIFDLTAIGLDIILIPQPEEPPPPPETTLEACDLILEVFNDDRETVRWSAATSLIFSNPFLVMPDRYAEQEIDPATGSATLTTVSCTVVDHAEEAGDQDGGFMTGKLAYQTLADIAGRRARLLRAIGDQPDTTLEVVIDGVAGPPRLDQSYAALGFEIRDFREVERKVRAFDGSVEIFSNSIIPLRPIIPYGFNDETQQFLREGVAPLEGTFIQNAGDFPNPSTGTVDVTGHPEDQRTVSIDVYRKMDGQVTESGPPVSPAIIAAEWQRVRFPNLAIIWRVNNSGDPYTVIDGSHLVLDIAFIGDRRFNLGVVTEDHGNDQVEVERFAFGDDRVAPAGVSPDPFDPPDPEAALPPDGTAIEFLVVAGGPASPANPFHIEFDEDGNRITAGQFAQNVYDGVYSARGPDGEIVPTGIRYDADALALMTDPVRMRLTEPITDARDWLEKYIYTPTGWIPALDRFGRISPVSQVPPDDIFGLPLIYDAITEPAPDWSAGDRIVNIVRFTYPRDYVPLNPENAETGDGLADVDVVLEFTDPVSVDRYGSHQLDIDGRAFRALGTTADLALGTPDGDPLLSGGQTAELGFQLAEARGETLLSRYAFGAPVMVVNVRREFTPTLRAGSWVRVFLSWFPDYVTQRRGLICLAQVTALGDLDCVWRRVQMEQVLPLGLYDAEVDVRYVLLIDDDGQVLIDDDGAVFIEEA